MNASDQGRIVLHARTDASDRLVEADDPLRELQQRCGGEFPGVVAIPELLTLVRRARRHSSNLSRTIRAFDGQDEIRAWVEAKPLGGGEDGCAIELSNWQSVTPAPDEADSGKRRIAIARAIAELTIRLDADQRILFADGEAPDVERSVAEMQQALGKPWTDFVGFPGNSMKEPLHWRLLDGADVALRGSERHWQATIIPLGLPEPGSAGFEVLLHSEQTPPEAQRPHTQKKGEVAAPSLGREVSPALRQPIARIIANAETIRTRLAGPLADEYADYAADISSAGQHLLELLEDFADLEVIEAESFTTAPDRIDLADVAQRTAGILGVRATERSIDLVMPPEDARLPAIGEFRRVLQILLNLVGNALNYAPGGSKVWIVLEQVGDRALLMVADQGPGMDEEQQRNAFEKFERLGRSGDGGSGLGLYISRKLARAMNGDLRVESAPGEGARFVLDLPAA